MKIQGEYYFCSNVMIKFSLSYCYRKIRANKETGIRWEIHTIVRSVINKTALSWSRFTNIYTVYVICKMIWWKNIQKLKYWTPRNQNGKHLSNGKTKNWNNCSTDESPQHKIIWMIFFIFILDMTLVTGKHFVPDRTVD